MFRMIYTTGIVTAVTLALGAPSHALNARTWVSGTGLDQAACGPIANPCRTLQYAHDNTSAGGEIDVKDSAGYGPLAITKAISVINEGGIAGVLAGNNSSYAVSVAADPSDSVVLRGLTVEGAGGAFKGIVFERGRLDVVNCTVQNFREEGIYVVANTASPSIFISNTNVSHNGGAGIFAFTNTAIPINMVLDRVTSQNNQYGVHVELSNGSTAAVNVVIQDTVAAYNTSTGMFFSGTSIKAVVDRSTASRNGASGFAVSKASLTIGRSASTSNGGIGLSNANGTVNSYKNNQVSGNANGSTSGTILTASFE